MLLDVVCVDCQYTVRVAGALKSRGRKTERRPQVVQVEGSKTGVEHKVFYTRCLDCALEAQKAHPRSARDGD